MLNCSAILTFFPDSTLPGLAYWLDITALLERWPGVLFDFYIALAHVLKISKTFAMEK